MINLSKFVQLPLRVCLGCLLFAGAVLATQVVTVPGFGSLSLPSSLEILDKQMRPDLAQGNPSAFFIQQVGLNSGASGALNTYARIIISQIDESEAPVGFLESKVEESPEEIKAVDAIYRDEIESQPGVIISKWFPVRVAKIGGNDAIQIHYIRKGNNKEGLDVEVKSYLVQNYIVSHVITTSWRIKEKDRWQNDIQSVWSQTNSVHLI